MKGFSDLEADTLDSVPTPPRWNLGDLFAADTDSRLEATLTTVRVEAEAFASRYRGEIANLSPEELQEALTEYERLSREASKPDTYINLRHSVESTSNVGAVLQTIQERTTQAMLPVLFFNLELAALPVEQLGTLAEDPALTKYRHYLHRLKAQAPYRLSEPEERILEERANTGRRAFARLFEEVVAQIGFCTEDGRGPLTLSEIQDLQSHPNRRERQIAANALTIGLEPHAATVAFIHNTLIQDKATEDRLRGFTYPEQARHLANDYALEIVDTLTRVVEEGYPLVARYYEAKRRLLGLDELAHYDRYAPLFPDEKIISFDKARDLCLTAFDSFHPKYADAARQFFTGGWIDAEVRPGKRGGAFCSYVTPDLHPYIFLNHLNKMGDMRTMAHELGHGIHTMLSRPQGFFAFHATLPICETASTFAEQLVFSVSEKVTTNREERLSLFAEQIEQAISTIFRQVALYRFEQAIHAERRASGELPVSRFGELWQEKIGAMFGDSVTLEEGHSLWWMYVRHFIVSPFYVYAYAAGEMLAFALFNRYQAEGDSFASHYLEFLSAGGAKSPEELVAPLGVDLTDENFWRGALSVLESQVEEFERLANSPV